MAPEGGLLVACVPPVGSMTLKGGWWEFTGAAAAAAIQMMADTGIIMVVLGQKLVLAWLYPLHKTPG